MPVVHLRSSLIIFVVVCCLGVLSWLGIEAAGSLCEIWLACTLEGTLVYYGVKVVDLVIHPRIFQWSAHHQTLHFETVAWRVGLQDAAAVCLYLMPTGSVVWFWYAGWPILTVGDETPQELAERWRNFSGGREW